MRELSVSAILLVPHVVEANGVGDGCISNSVVYPLDT